MTSANRLPEEAKQTEGTCPLAIVAIALDRNKLVTLSSYWHDRLSLASVSAIATPLSPDAIAALISAVLANLDSVAGKLARDRICLGGEVSDAIPILEADESGVTIAPGNTPADRLAAGLAGLRCEESDLFVWVDRLGGEAIACKRLADAERDGDRIYAVIKSVDTGETLATAIERTFQANEIAPESLSLLHLPNADIDLAALENLFGLRGDRLPHCALARSQNIADVALSLDQKIIPPGESPWPAERFAERGLPFFENQQPRPWIRTASSPNRAGIARSWPGNPSIYLVLEEYPPQSAIAPRLDTDWPSELLVLSAPDADTLRDRLQALRDRAQEESISLKQLAVELAAAPKQLHRAAIVAETLADLDAKLDRLGQKLAKHPETLRLRQGAYYAAHSDRRDRQVAFLFPGQGAQYPNMLLDLCVYFPQLQAWFDDLNATYASANTPLPSQFVFVPPTGLTETERERATKLLYSLSGGAQATFIANIALHELIENFGIRCDLMLGHSNGENSALVASGHMKFSDRAQVLQLTLKSSVDAPSTDAKYPIPTGAIVSANSFKQDVLDEILAEYADRVYLAMDNCPHQVVLFGPPEDMETVVDRLNQSGSICTRLPFDRAYHTPLYRRRAQNLKRLYDSIPFGPGHTPLYSCATAELFPNEPDAIRATAAYQWEVRVRFREAIERLYERGVDTFIEIGPGNVLTAFVDDILRGRDYLAVPTNLKQRSGLWQLQNLLAQLYVRGLPVDLTPLFAPRSLGRFAGDRDLSRSNEQTPEPPPTANHEPTAEVTRSAIEPRPPSLNPPPVPEPANGAPSVAPAPPPQATATLDVSTAPASVPTPKTAIDPRLSLVDRHFSLMQEFLASQQRVTTATLARLSGKGGLTPAALPEVVSPPEREFPLLGPAIEQTSDRLYCERCFSLDEDLFLLDHALGSKQRLGDTGLVPLAVVPLTVSFDLIAQAAACLLGGEQVVVGLSQVRSLRWLALDREELNLGILAQRETDAAPGTTEVSVKVFELGNLGDPPRQTVFSGRVQLAPAFGAPGEARSLPLDPSRPPELAVSTFYDRFLFHGPCFQSIRQVTQWNERTIVGIFTVPSERNFFRDREDAHFQVPGNWLDSVGQLIAFWFFERGHREFGLFPFGVQRYRQYRSPLSEGDSLTVRAQVAEVAHGIYTADFDVFDREGHLIVQIDGWQMRYYVSRLIPWILRPQGEASYLSRAWMEAETGLICRRIDTADLDVLEDNWGIWKRSLAHLHLSRREREIWYDFAPNSPRRTEWLLGRIAAKEALQQWAQQTYGIGLAAAAIAIVPGSAGQPEISCRELSDRSALPALSIAHSRGKIVAAVAPPGNCLGIDIESLDPPRGEPAGQSDPLENAFSAAELARLPDRQRATLVAFWSAKEAAAKACQRGLEGVPQQWQIAEIRGNSVTIAREGRTFPVNVWRTEQDVFSQCQYPDTNPSQP